MTKPNALTRRTFLETSSAGALAAGLPFGVHGGAGETLKVGVVGCGGRGTGAAVQALSADPDTVLWAMGDAFDDRIERARQGLEQTGVAERAKVPAERRFAGLDAYQKVIDSGIDVVVLAAPPHFRPVHLDHAVSRNVHVFAEKPVAVDAPGARRVRASCERARQQGISIVSGLCYRYHDGRRATMEQVHGGRIGRIVSMDVRYITGGLWHRGEDEEWSDLEYQLRNWVYYSWLSGDHINEQHIHSLDVMAWAMRDEYPVSAVALGGRQSRTAGKYGNVFDHFATLYEWEDGVTGHAYCRQQNGCHRDVSDHFAGTEGRCDFFDHAITGKRPWKYEGEVGNMYQNEHDALFAAIRAGEPIDNGDYMCNSTMMAIMGRMAGYTGEKVTWEQAWASQERLGPEEYEWGAVEVEPVARPGVTKFS